MAGAEKDSKGWPKEWNLSAGLSARARANERGEKLNPNVSDVQFMHVSRLLNLPSVEGKYDPEGNPVQGGYRVRDVLKGRGRARDKFRENRHDNEHEPGYAERINDAISRRTVDPVHVAPAGEMAGYRKSGDYGGLRPGRMMLGNGHHRVARAVQNGQMWLPVTRDSDQSWHTYG